MVKVHVQEKALVRSNKSGQSVRSSVLECINLNRHEDFDHRKLRLKDNSKLTTGQP